MPCEASCLLASRSLCAIFRSDSAFETVICCCSRVVATCARWLARVACAVFQSISAFLTACCKSGLTSSRMTVPGFTWAPGRSTMRSTRPEAVDVTHLISSGTSVPGPRTSRTMGPRLTVPNHSVSPGTLGAAGCRRLTAMLMPMTTTAPRPSRTA